MKKIYIILACLLLFAGSSFAQQWLWSKVIPSYPSYDNAIISSAITGDHYFIYQTSYGVTPEASRIVHMDPNGNITGTLNFNFKVEKFVVDPAGNYISIGMFSGSFTYGGSTIYSHGLNDIFILKTTSTGGLIFLKGCGSTYDDYAVTGMTTDSASRIYLLNSLAHTIHYDNDSIVNDTSYRQFVVMILNADGSLNSSIIRSFNINPYGVGDHYSSGISIGKHGDIFVSDNYCYPNQCDGEITQYSSLHDSVNFYFGGSIDDPVATVYFLTNPGSHYEWEPVLNKFRISDRKIIWSKSLGDEYGPYELSSTLLPGNILLTFGRGGRDGISESATLDDTTFNFNSMGMLLALMDTSSHFYSFIHDAVPHTHFTGASYDNSGNAYLISDWQTDTTYTMGTSITSHTGDHVISKLKYMEVTSGIASIETKNEIRIYPNPSNGNFNVKLNDRLKRATICVYDVLGNCIYSQNLTGASVNLDMSGNAKGIYFVQIKNGNEAFNKKIIIN